MSGSGDLAFGVPLRIQEVKASSDGAWEVSGYASTFGNVDLGGDVIHRGAFSASLKSGAPVRFLYSHNPADVLGTALSLKEDDKGLLGRWRISKTRLGEDVHTLLKDGALDSFSIGYLPRDFDYDEDAGTRRLKEVELLEVSVVAMPMNPQAVVTAVKGADYSRLDLEAVLRVYEAHRTSALAQAKAVAERRLSEGRKLSDRTLEALERLRVASEEDAAVLLRLATTPPAEKKDDPPAAVETAGLVGAHLRRARINESRLKSGLPPHPWVEAPQEGNQP